MLEIASAAAAEAEATKIDFQEGSITNLSRYEDRAFDVVLCLDSPLSFCFREHIIALDELIRVCAHSLVLCVTSRLGVIAHDGILFDLRRFGKPQTVLQVVETGDMIPTDELRRAHPLLPPRHLFGIEEIERLVAERDFRVRTIEAPGTLAAFVPPELILSVHEKCRRPRSGDAARREPVRGNSRARNNVALRMAAAKRR